MPLSPWQLSSPESSEDRTLADRDPDEGRCFDDDPPASLVAGVVGVRDPPPPLTEEEVEVSVVEDDAVEETVEVRRIEMGWPLLVFVEAPESLLAGRDGRVRESVSSLGEEGNEEEA
jgi:hypothetical protein